MISGISADGRWPLRAVRSEQVLTSSMYTQGMVICRFSFSRR